MYIRDILNVPDSNLFYLCETSHFLVGIALLVLHFIIIFIANLLNVGMSSKKISTTVLLFSGKHIEFLL